MKRKVAISKWRILFGFTLIISIIVAMLLSNINVIKDIVNPVATFVKSDIEPYLIDSELYRYSINEINQKLDTIVLTIDGNIDEVDINYQRIGEDTFVSCGSYEIIEQDKKYRIVLDDEVKNFYVDLFGHTEKIPTIEVEAKKPTLSIEADACIFGICILLLYMVCWFHKDFFSELYRNRDVIKTLTLNDIKARYAGAFLGIFWSFAQPILTVLIFWVVFQKGFRSAPVQNVPYILWFIPAYIPWVFFQDTIINATGCMREYSYLVKKMKFKISVLPAIKLLSSLLIHFVFLIFMFLIFTIYRIEPSIFYIQVFYYMFAMFVFSAGVAWLVSALAVFMKDFSQIVSIILQIGYFAIPVFWSTEDMEPTIIKILQLNPMYYIVQGYRDSMIGTVGFWNYPVQTIYFWLVTVGILFVGVYMFEKLKKHFADLL